MVKPPKKPRPEKIETKPDAWERFERTMDKMVPPKRPKLEQSPLKSGDYFVVIDGKMRIAHENSRNDDGSISSDLYRNLDDYRTGRVMEPNVNVWI